MQESKSAGIRIAKKEQMNKQKRLLHVVREK